MSVILREQSRQASCRLQLRFLTSFPLPESAVLDGCSKWLGQLRYVAGERICAHILYFCW